MTTMLAIAAVDALKPAPFTVHPLLALTLKDQVGTVGRYIQAYDPEVCMDDLEAHARALEMTGVIDAEELKADWTIDQDEIDAEEAQADGDRGDALYADNGMPEPELDNVQEIEPIA